MSKKIFPYSEVKDRILAGLEELANPVTSTLSPKGSNVIYETKEGEFIVTNDGVTIGDEIQLEDPVKNTIVSLVRQAARKTNMIAGDGTTTSILLASTLIREGFKLLDSGWNPMTLKAELERAGDIINQNIGAQAKKVADKKDMLFVAKVSANNDEAVAKDVVEVIDVVGEDGQVFIEDHMKDETLLIKEIGFTLDSGLYSPQLANIKGRFEARYTDAKILITDKRIYNSQEVVAILRPLVEEGVKDVVIVARDFIGQSPNLFLANHVKGKINILLVKDPEKTEKNTDALEDLAAYLNAPFITDKHGKLTTNLFLKDFGTVKKVFSNPQRTLFYAEPNTSSKLRIEAIREELKTCPKKDEENLRKRLAKMTTGTVTIKVGGKTLPEIRERMYRYEDSVNATRAAMKDGYVVGGGLTLYNAFTQASFGEEIGGVIQKACLAPLRKIAENCDIHLGTMLEKVGGETGYNASTGKYENLRKAGVIEPLLVAKLSWQNAISVAAMILSSKYIIVNNHEQEDK